ncbi:hypothetical protein HN873_008673, partial [Arachis hypogaea]
RQYCTQGVFRVYRISKAILLWTQQLFARANLILFPRIPDEETLGEPPTPTTVHVRFLLDLTNYPSYLLYVLDSPSLSQ